MVGQWRPIARTGGVYEVSAWGDVRRVGKPNPMKANVRKRDGYLQIDLSVKGARITARVHVLVCEAFHGPCPAGKECAHADGVRTNNVEANLRWATHVENALDRVAHDTQPRGSLVTTAKLTEDAVREIRLQRKRGAVLRVIAEQFGVSAQTVDKICRRERWAHLV